VSAEPKLKREPLAEHVPPDVLDRIAVITGRAFREFRNVDIPIAHGGRVVMLHIDKDGHVTRRLATPEERAAVTGDPVHAG
jgi:hypothetical protein